jgi:hypothetical protein
MYANRASALMRKRVAKCKTDHMAALTAEAGRDIEELANQIRRCCSDKKWTGDQKREACRQLVKLAGLSTKKMLHLATEFPEPFREIAEQCSAFPCFFLAFLTK